MASTTAGLTMGCYPSAPGVDITGDSSTLRTGQTFAVYAADRDTFFLDFETFSLAGTKDGSDYAFTGEDVDVMTVGDSTVTVTTITSINAEIKGKKISGTSVVDTISHCSGGTSCPNPSSSQCITTVAFQGAEVKDVDLEHAI